MDDYRNTEYQDFVEILIQNLIEYCSYDEQQVKQLITHLDEEISDDLRSVLSKMRDEKINNILNERS